MLLPMTSCEVGRSHSNNNDHHQCLVSHSGRWNYPSIFFIKENTRLFIISKVIKAYAAKKHIGERVLLRYVKQLLINICMLFFWIFKVL